MPVNISPILVVGAGWLGEPLAKQLQQEGHRVVVTARRPERIAELQSAGLSAWRLDLADAGETFGLSDRLQSFHTLILAIPPGKTGSTVYAEQLQRLLAHWPEQTGRKLIFYSSTGVYPEEAGAWKESSPIKTDHAVAAAEQVVQAWGKEGLILRCGGLCDERRVIGRYFAGRDLSNADQPVNYVHRVDVIAATNHLLAKGLSGCYNVVAPLHPSRQQVFHAQARRYQIEWPSSAQPGGINRLISVEKLLNTGYQFLQPDPKDF